MKRYKVAMRVWMLLCLMPGASFAGTLRINLTLDGSQILLGVPGQIVASGQNVVGNASVSLVGVSSVGALTGAMPIGSLGGLTLQLTFTAPGNPPAMAFLSQERGATGAFDGGSFRFAPGVLSLQARTSVRGAAFTVRNLMTVQPSVFSLDSPGDALLSLSAFLPGVASPLAVQLNLTGREVSRSFVPEPSELAGLALGLIGFAASIWLSCRPFRRGGAGAA